MNILFVVPSYKPAYIYGGPIVVIAELAETLASMGHRVTIYTTTANGRHELTAPQNAPVVIDGVVVYYFRRITKDHTHMSPALWMHLDRHIDAFDAVHIHSWWNLLVLGAAAICKKHRIRPTLSPHGMFSTYIIQTNNRWKKAIIHHTVGKRLLQHTLLHTSSELEWAESLKINPCWKGSVIPNLLTLPTAAFDKPGASPVVRIGFLSRIDPKKGLDRLIQTLARVTFDYTLHIAGSGPENYIQYLKALSLTEGNAQKIEWVGWKDGQDKYAFLAGLDFLTLLSHSENFALVVIEALAVGTPVIISDQVGVCTYIAQKDFGWVVDAGADDLPVLFESITRETDKINLIRSTAPVIIGEEFKGTHLAAKYLDMYQWHHS